MHGAETFETWEDIFRRSGYNKVSISKHDMDYRGFLAMIADEGVSNSIRIFSKFMRKKYIRSRMRKLRSFFRKNKEYTGYGIFITTN